MSDLRKAYQIASLVNISIVGSLIIYVVIVEIVRRQCEHFISFVDPSELTTLRYILYGIAVFNIFIIRIFRGLLLRKSPSDDSKALRVKLLRSSILTSALCEVPAIFGLVLFFIAGSVRDFYYLSFVSLILAFLYFPRFRNWEGWAGDQPKS